MAEILLSLTIIGVVAAITLPSLTGNINERTWNTQRKALYARMSQAIALMPALNGYGTYTASTESTSAVDTAAEAFLTEGLSKVLKINNICDSEHLADCGIVSSYTNILGESKVMPKKLSEFNSTFTTAQSWGGGSYINPQKDIDTKTAAFETQNGESILVVYNPYCISDPRQSSGWYYTQPLMCANFIYDLNGNKGPNTVGKDIGFISVMEPSDPVVVAPMPLVRDAGSAGQTQASALCAAQDSDSRLPNKDEIASMFFNRELLGMYSDDYWSSSVISADYAWDQSFLLGGRYACTRAVSHKHSVRCIKR